MIQEFAHVYARRRSRVEAVSLARQLRDGLLLLVAGLEDLSLGLELFEHHSSLGAFDAMLAAVALNHRAEALVSGDRAFAWVPGLHWVDPSTSALNRLIGA